MGPAEPLERPPHFPSEPFFSLFDAVRLKFNPPSGRQAGMQASAIPNTQSRGCLSQISHLRRKNRTIGARLSYLIQAAHASQLVQQRAQKVQWYLSCCQLKKSYRWDRVDLHLVFNLSTTSWIRESSERDQRQQKLRLELQQTCRQLLVGAKHKAARVTKSAGFSICGWKRSAPWLHGAGDAVKADEDRCPNESIDAAKPVAVSVEPVEPITLQAPVSHSI